MKYARVIRDCVVYYLPKEYFNRTPETKHITYLVRKQAEFYEGELLTRREFEKIKLPESAIEWVDVKKNTTYFFFGLRTGEGNKLYCDLPLEERVSKHTRMRHYVAEA